MSPQQRAEVRRFNLETERALELSRNDAGPGDVHASASDEEFNAAVANSLSAAAASVASPPQQVNSDSSDEMMREVIAGSGQGNWQVRERCSAYGYVSLDFRGSDCIRCGAADSLTWI